MEDGVSFSYTYDNRHYLTNKFRSSILIAELFNTRTISGKEELQFNSYLYEKRLIIRETMDDGSGHHMVHCCHCHHSWGPYDAKYTTTSTFIAHLRTRHARLPSREGDYKSAVGRLLAKTSSIISTRSEISPFTLARGRLGPRAAGHLFDNKEYRKLIAVMVLETNSSFQMVESNAFRALMAYCNGSAIAISRRTIKRDIEKTLYKELFQNLRVRLQDHVSAGAKVNLTIDAWTSSNKLPFLAITAHWIDTKYEKYNTLIGFERLRGSHTAGNMADVLVKVLNIYGIREAINCITADNATVNDGIFLDLALEMQEWSQEDGQIRCLAHVLNLAAQTVLKTLRSEAEEPEVDLASDDLHDLGNNNEVDPATAIHKLRQIVAKIRSSNILWELLQEDVQRKRIVWLVPVLDVRVRWNSTHKMIKRALYLRPALERFLAIDNSRKFSKARIPLTLSQGDWNILERVEKVLALFVDATEFASGSTYPTLSSQLPYYQFLQNALHELIQNESRGLIDENLEHNFSVSRICAAADDAYQKLNQYWIKTDSNTGQVIATILDPRMKLQLFRNLEWEATWIDNARDKFIRIFNKRYARVPIATLSSGAGEQSIRPASQRIRSIATHETPANRRRYEDLVFGVSTEEPDDDLLESQVNIYLREARVDRNMDIIQWWKLHEHRLPNLALMARDYLSVPATRCILNLFFLSIINLYTDGFFF